MGSIVDVQAGDDRLREWIRTDVNATVGVANRLTADVRIEPAVVGPCDEVCAGDVQSCTEQPCRCTIRKRTRAKPQIRTVLEEIRREIVRSNSIRVFSDARILRVRILRRPPALPPGARNIGAWLRFGAYAIHVENLSTVRALKQTGELETPPGECVAESISEVRRGIADVGAIVGGDHAIAIQIRDELVTGLECRDAEVLVSNRGSRC